MLRALFGEPRRSDEGTLREANAAIHRYMNALARIPVDAQSVQERRFVIWCENFLRALDELEQSQYAAGRFGTKVHKLYVDEMKEAERDDYHRHLYFYKNAIIRMFSILDKLGYFLNERFALHTERAKARFSYFTVLRTMHQNQVHAELERRLFELKQETQEPVNRLRNQRNMEIHTINTDLLDDLMEAAEAKYGKRPRQQTEEVPANLKDLKIGYTMTCRAVAIVFGYLVRLPHKPHSGESAGRG